MRILPRYILREVIANALVGMGVFTFVIFMRDAGRCWSWWCATALPFPAWPSSSSLQFRRRYSDHSDGSAGRILTGLSRLAADSEITALRASGVGSRCSSRCWVWARRGHLHRRYQ